MYFFSSVVCTALDTRSIKFHTEGTKMFYNVILSTLQYYHTFVHYINYTSLTQVPGSQDTVRFCFVYILISKCKRNCYPFCVCKHVAGRNRLELMYLLLNFGLFSICLWAQVNSNHDFTHNRLRDSQIQFRYKFMDFSFSVYSKPIDRF